MIAASLKALVEDAFDDRDPFWERGHVSHDVALRLLDHLARRQDAHQLAVGVELLLSTIREPSELSQDLAIRTQVLLVVSVRSGSPWSTLPFHDV